MFSEPHKGWGQKTKTFTSTSGRFHQRYRTIFIGIKQMAHKIKLDRVWRSVRKCGERDRRLQHETGIRGRVHGSSGYVCSLIYECLKSRQILTRFKHQESTNSILFALIQTVIGRMDENTSDGVANSECVSNRSQQHLLQIPTKFGDRLVHNGSDAHLWSRVTSRDLTRPLHFIFLSTARLHRSLNLLRARWIW